MKDLLNSEIAGMLIQQIGIALGHSLWIGALAALLAAMVVTATRRSKPEIRYNLLTGILLTFIVAIGVVFFLAGSAVPSNAVLSQQLPSQNITANTAISTSTHRSDFITTILNFLVLNLRTITLLWLVIVIGKISGLMIGFYRLHQLKTRQIYAIGKHWEQRVDAFAQAMGIRQSVKIFQSGLVKVPTVLGHFKPVILVPLGVITSIPADQIEMVLLHELAHIRRLDFFVNFIQRLVELLFFFNPGILWISKLIREERENCCDDMALAYSGSKTTYIHALLSFREYELNDNVYQLSFSGKGGLVQRAKRIASRSNSTLGMIEKTVLLVTLLAFFTFSILYAQSRAPQAHSKKTSQAAQEHSSQQTIAPTPAKSSEAFKRNKPDKLARTIDNQPVIEQPNSNRLSSKPTLHDTLHPLQKPLAPMYQPASVTLADSSGNGRLTSLRNPYVQTYKTQPLQSYQPLYQPSPVRAQRQAINEKILSEIERQGIPVSRNDVDFRITNKELIVNGVKQPQTVLQAVLDVVLTSPDDVIDFTYGSHP